jgi:hypothetical protein
VMIATRKVDWFALGEPMGEPLGEPREQPAQA